MGKRSDFERIERDFYPTPLEAVAPLLPHLEPSTLFHEPCCGDGALIDHLERHGHDCLAWGDIEPQLPGAATTDAMTLTRCRGDVFITNPPWDRKILHPIIRHLSSIAPTWLLFDADWMHTRQSVEFMAYCHKIVSVGRVKWIPDTAMTGKDNAAWYLFDQKRPAQTIFVGRR
jgi:hypothetical protein